MAEVGYVPDLVARSMSQQRTRTVAALVPNLFDPAFAVMIQGLSEVVSAGGMRLLLGNTDYSPEEEERLVIALLGHRPEGLALTGTTHTVTLKRLLRQAAIPVVEMWNMTRNPLDMAVGFWNQAAGEAITNHMIARGYRRIGFVGRPRRGNERTAARQRGYRLAMQAAGLEVQRSWILETDGHMDAGTRAFDRLSLGREIEAVVVTGDTVATGIFLEALARGLRIPDDLAISGFGDLPIAARLPGGLTTVRIDSYEVGRQAGNLILTRARGEPVASRVIDAGFEVTPRGST